MGKAGELQLRAKASKAIRNWPSLFKAQRSVWVKTAAVALFVLCLDLGTKTLVANSYLVGQEGEFFSLGILHLQNPGISLGFATLLGLIDNGVQLPIYLFAILGITISVAVSFRLAEFPLFWLPAGLVLGGLGNVVELVYHGYATDFIRVSTFGRAGSANIADFAIVLGLGLFILVDVVAAATALARKYRGAPTGSSS
jgi:lipoprotein signal peptidase